MINIFLGFYDFEVFSQRSISYDVGTTVGDTVCVSVNIINDGIVEDEEAFAVNFHNYNMVQFSSNQIVVTIQDDDSMYYMLLINVV